MTYQLVATCLFGLEHILGEEIDALGFHRLETIDGRVTFEGDETAVAKANLWLRTAERVFILLGKFRAVTFTELFDGTNALPWEQFIPLGGAFPVKGHSIKSTLFSVPDCQKIVKKAVAKRLASAYGTEWLPEDGVLYQIEFFLLKDEVALMIDTSGTALHKRGYRPQSIPAPLRETLAAALVRFARMRENVLLHDPFCGSGTIAIEAAMLMTNTAPGLNRSFAAEKFAFLPPDLFERARAEARAAVCETEFEAYASDIDSEAVRNAEMCVRAAGMERYVKVFRQDALTIATEGRRGTIVTNPPYGERLGTLDEAEALYRKMGKHFQTLAPWQIYVITAHDGFEKLYGRRADKVRKLYNGMIPCYFYQFFKNPDQKKRENPKKKI
ncbi:MAG: class I SAM-dependent RNA methyltransferase [Clostridia bacterium]|nr:class I SAM-dependent RNA methyltransferase [Clostridia bacterium]